MSEILFQISVDQLETGMRGYPVGYCPTSYVDPEKGLFYAGRSLEEIAHWDPEKVIFLLYYGREGGEKEIHSFFKKLNVRSTLKKETIESIKALPRKGHPMKLFSAALLILGMLEKEDDYQEDALNVIAKLPHLVATLINFHAEWGDTPEPHPELGYMENFAHMVQMPGKNLKTLTELFRLFNVLHYDHGGGNLSTFVGKAVASGLEDMFGSLSSAMSALAGPRHGKANQDSLLFVKEVYQHVKGKCSFEEVEKFLRDRLEKNLLVFGFGHAVLRVEDPRATVLYDFAQRVCPNNPLVKTALFLRTAGSKVLSENPKISDPHPNVDAISGIVLSGLGFDYPQYFTLLFGLARCVGIAIQIVYERLYARGGKGTPIIRPKYFYKPRV